MKSLNDLLRDVNVKKIKGNTDDIISGITYDSREVIAGSMFFAIKGTRVDGHNFIQQVIDSGAVAIVCENLPENLINGVAYIQVEDSSYSSGIIASNWFGNPSKKLKLVGITGTNGKTTTVTLLFNLFRELGYHTGLLSTILNRIDDEIIPSTHTTPDAIHLNQLLSHMAEKGCSYCFMEVSSHSIVQNRIAGLTFAGGIFSNITLDHLDFHKTFDEYLKAKKRFFDELPSTAFALTNLDDRNGLVMLQNTKASKHTYSFQKMADFKGRIIEAPLDGLHLDLDGNEIWCRLVGKFNGYNLMAVYAAGVLLEQDPLEVLTILSNLESVEGRFDYIKSPQGIIGIVDYAHTPDALQNVLETINQLRTGNEMLITVVGCGGDRDKSKRPIMAKIAARLSDRVILTSDNPRSEVPEQIIAEMLAGVEKEFARNVQNITDRHDAIRIACAMTRDNDVILIAGKGHEKYQDIKGVKHPFDDKEILKKYLL
ncbi:MAG: UDP-N-acetylmuramoyl-L-alanyl-D-glutamate--2,6-diaminopimelate ligase [Bacteroidales bacterium]|nr:UDP-N-acetylmuramoyl-L-alanyl-D-glutamate--2,6-diaminopimelate ligase [Bacteroidales bacterium]